jgi:hypothetical protein
MIWRESSTYCKVVVSDGLSLRVTLLLHWVVFCLSRSPRHWSYFSLMASP